MEDTITKEEVSAECEAIGELEVIHRLAADGLWGGGTSNGVHSLKRGFASAIGSVPRRLKVPPEARRGPRGFLQ